MPEKGGKLGHKFVPRVLIRYCRSIILVYTTKLTRVIDEMVREFPDHWLWVHNRWKTNSWQAA